MLVSANGPANARSDELASAGHVNCFQGLSILRSPVYCDNVAAKLPFSGPLNKVRLD